MTGLDLYLFAAKESAFTGSRKIRKGFGFWWKTSPHQVEIFQINENSDGKLFLFISIKTLQEYSLPIV